MKGSLGRIPVYPWSATEMLSHAGPMTRSVIDSQILFDVLKGPDSRDHLSIPNDGQTYEGAKIDVSTLRIAFESRCPHAMEVCRLQQSDALPWSDEGQISCHLMSWNSETQKIEQQATTVAEVTHVES